MSSPSQRFAVWLDGLSPQRRSALAREYAEGLSADGFSILTRDDPETFVLMPAALTPEVWSEARRDALETDARHLTSALTRLSFWLLGGNEPELAARLFGAFTPLEHEAFARDPEGIARLAVGRADFFFDAGGQPRVLELNSTIPALPGYTEMLQRRWLELIARERGKDPSPLVTRLWSPAEDLHASLLAHYRGLGGAKERPSIGVVSRRGDTELAELRYYVRRFGEMGHEAAHVHADEITLDESGRATSGGRTFDLLYRHIFARKTDPSWPYARLLVDPGPNVVLNPLTSPLEVKGMFALLHDAARDSRRARQLGLVPDEVEALHRILPWTRLLASGPATLPDGHHVEDLVAHAAAHPEAFVLKRSWDYGGKGVLIGSDVDPDEWARRVREVAAGEELWILQERITPRRARHYLISRGPDGETRSGWEDVLVDAGVYVNQGVDVRPRSLTCRASRTSVVNVAGGGGMAPVIPQDVFDALF